MPRFENLDADESVFFLRQLEHVKSRAYDVKYPEKLARRLIPVSGEAGEGAETITYEQYDHRGVAKIIRDYAKDLPRVDVKGKEFTVRVKGIGDSYGYNRQEIRAARMAGKNLTQRRANAAREAHLELENDLALLGSTDEGFTGLLKHPNATSVTLAADGSGGLTTFASKTPDQVLRDLNKIANTPFIVSKGVFTPNTMLMPLEQYSDISTRRIPDTNVTILKFFLENQLFIKEVIPLNEIKGIGASNSDRCQVYRRDPEYITMEVPMDFQQGNPQEQGLEYVVPCEARYGGVIAYYPLAIAYADGV